VLDEASLDKYSFTRDAYLQRRNAEVFDFRDANPTGIDALGSKLGRDIGKDKGAKDDGKDNDGAEPPLEPEPPKK
jgi:hypothetical protein